MLTDAPSFSSFSVRNVQEEKQFLEGVLGLKVKEHEGMGLEVFTAGTSGIFVYPKGDSHEPATFTVLNFIADDVRATVRELTSKGVVFERYDTEFIKTDEDGIADQGNGRLMAWFKDPSGNIFSLMYEPAMTEKK